MNKSKQLFISLLAISLFTGSCAVIKSSTEERLPKKETVANELYAEIFHMDSILFIAFNSRDIEKLKSLFSKDLEFYHDKDGLTSYTQTIESFIKMAAKKNDLKRELLPGSLEVYPLKDFGAMQVGVHRFCHTEKGKADCGTFKFMHIWKQEKGEWKISRVISYGH